MGKEKKQKKYEEDYNAFNFYEDEEKNEKPTFQQGEKQNPVVKNKIPYYTADVDDAYVQTNEGVYFRGQGFELPFGCNDKAYYIFENPIDSGVNIWLNKTYHTNLSGTPMRVNMFCCADVKGNVQRSNRIQPANMYECNNFEPKARIYSGTNLRIIGGSQTYTFAVDKYFTFRGNPKGSMLLSPGTIYIAETAAIERNSYGKTISSFAWWEEPISKKNCKIK